MISMDTDHGLGPLFLNMKALVIQAPLLMSAGENGLLLGHVRLIKSPTSGAKMGLTLSMECVRLTKNDLTPSFIVKMTCYRIITNQLHIMMI